MDNPFCSSHIKKLLDEGQVQIAIILIALHIERDLCMLIDFYYRPKDVIPLLNRLKFSQIINLARELNIFKRSHWFSYFEQIRELRNMIAHNFDYWIVLSKDEKEHKKAEVICRNNLKFFEVTIPELRHEFNDDVSDAVAKNLSKTMLDFRKNIESGFKNIFKNFCS